MQIWKFQSFLLLRSLYYYLFYFLINGERGIISYIKINKQQQEYRLILDTLNKKNDFFEDRVSRLQPNTIDLDFLEENT